MSRFYMTLIAPVIALAFTPSTASAQYYAPIPAQTFSQHQPGGLGVDLGLRNFGFNPSVGVGVGQLGAGVGAGLGPRSIGAGVNTGVGPIGVSTDAGLSRHGLGARGSAGIANTGAAFEGGLSRGGVGVGASAKVLGLGGGASVGIGNRGPGLGASLAFGSIGTLLIGSHRNSYPGAAQTSAFTHPSQKASYYAPQNYGNSPYYQSAPLQYAKPATRRKERPVSPAFSVCQAPWTC